MSESPATTPWSVDQRIDFIRQRLIWQGSVNRADLVAAFQVSANQATVDLRQFEARFPGGLAYDPRQRTYRPGPGLAAADEQDALALLRLLRLQADGVASPGPCPVDPLPPVDQGGLPLRPVPPKTLSTVLTAIREGRAMNGVYVSMSTATPRRRRLEPHALVFDGFRWHARARDAEAQDPARFKDFVLGRLSEVALEGPATGGGATADASWQRLVCLTLEPHKDLTQAQRAAILLDYGMDPHTGTLTLTVREATLWYVRRRLGLVQGHQERPAAEQHIVLRHEAPVQQAPEGAR